MSGDAENNAASLASFHFGPPELLPEAAILAEIPACIRSKQKLLRTLADQLQLPAYFGRNWDALEECLRNLSWLPAGSVQISHRDLPLPPGSHERWSYVQVLHAATRHWQLSLVNRLVCRFPAQTTEEIQALLRE